MREGCRAGFWGLPAWVQVRAPPLGHEALLWACSLAGEMVVVRRTLLLPHVKTPEPFRGSSDHMLNHSHVSPELAAFRTQPGAQ